MAQLNEGLQLEESDIPDQVNESSDTERLSPREPKKRQICKTPPWWTWVLIFIGICILAALIVLMVFFVPSKYKKQY